MVINFARGLAGFVCCLGVKKRRGVLVVYFLKIFQTRAARMPPMMGATQNTQSWLSAVVLSKMAVMSAGPKLLAGFTDVPVRGMPTRWTRVSVKPMAMPAKPLGDFSCVAPCTAKTKMNVSTISAIRAGTRPKPLFDVEKEFCPRPVYAMLYPMLPDAIR